ncbi:TPA: hypothetical protein EYN98_29910 [Candidatus Poribacteria bacterium]|jgi:hypothetical protein|nr:hypothetical protein [Candidatus Poribacteria bacterium]HIA70188.1 hypothetical protein [Candidatus Poribacteria bacterium]HIB98357.1 hypothetical protein [Candidatus Poribacteria bacterium]
MPYKFQPGKMYMMPTHFGPSMGPRQGPEGRTFECKDNPKTTSISVSFLTNREQLEELLPEGFEVGDEPVVSVSASYMKEIEWLAGRGYNILGVSFSAIFNGERDRAKGGLLTVLWENLCDPILTGREQLGFSKIYCELPEPTVLNRETHCIASWLGFKFMDMKLTNMTPVSLNPSPAPAAEQPDDGVLKGTLHYKYMPRTEEWDHADVGYAVLTPAEGSNSVVKEMWRGEGTVEFHKARWEDLPTQYHIVNAFHELEIKEYRVASIVKSVGGKDLSDQRILR